MVIDMYPAHILESGEIQTVREHCRSTAELLAFASGAHHGLFDCIGVHQDSGFFHRQTKEGIGYEESVQNYLKECVDAATLDSLFQQSVQEITAVIERITQLTAQESDEEANREITFHIGLLARLLVSAVRDAQTICWEQFSSMAVIGALPLLVLAGWCLSPQVFSRAAKILWVLVVVVGVICIAGLAGQFRWQNLLETTAVFSRAINKINIPIYAEYFALSLVDSKETSTQTSYRMSWLPLGAFLLEVGCRLGIELLFGSAQDYPGYELLRAWTLGMFSRLDSLILLVWLTIGLFRICLLVQILRTLAERFFGSTVLNREVES